MNSAVGSAQFKMVILLQDDIYDLLHKHRCSLFQNVVDSLRQFWVYRWDIVESIAEDCEFLAAIQRQTHLPMSPRLVKESTRCVKGEDIFFTRVASTLSCSSCRDTPPTTACSRSNPSTRVSVWKCVEGCAGLPLQMRRQPGISTAISPRSVLPTRCRLRI